MSTRVAVMQPYFVPYLGYFRLFAMTDIFVVLDNVQFPRRGYVHRNRLPDRLGRPQWLTLPLRKAPIETKIRELDFRADAKERLQVQWRRFPVLDKPTPVVESLLRLMLRFELEPVEYLISTIEHVCDLLGAPWRVVRASQLPIPDDLRGQARMIEIVRQLGGTSYVNAPGGRHLYDTSAFKAAGISLRFLSDYPGSPWSVLWRLASDPLDNLRGELRHSSLSPD